MHADLLYHALPLLLTARLVTLGCVARCRRVCAATRAFVDEDPDLRDCVVQLLRLTPRHVARFVRDGRFLLHELVASRASRCRECGQTTTSAYPVLGYLDPPFRCCAACMADPRGHRACVPTALLGSYMLRRLSGRPAVGIRTKDVLASQMRYLLAMLPGFDAHASRVPAWILGPLVDGVQTLPCGVNLRALTYREYDGSERRFTLARRGAKWDRFARRWWVPPGVDLRLFTRWMAGLVARDEVDVHIERRLLGTLPPPFCFEDTLEAVRASAAAPRYAAAAAEVVTVEAVLETATATRVTLRTMLDGRSQ